MEILIVIKAFYESGNPILIALAIIGTIAIISPIGFIGALFIKRYRIFNSH